MTSLFDELFDGSAATHLMEINGDSQTIQYTIDGNTTTDIVAMLGHREIAEIEGIDGTIRKVERWALHMMRDEASKWKGVPDPQFKGRFLIDGLAWKIEDRDAVPIEGKSRTMVTIGVVRKLAVHKGTPQMREFT